MLLLLMSTTPLHPCPAPGCRRLTRDRYCSTCARKREQARGSAQARGYTAAWTDYARAWLQQYPWCGQRDGGTFHVEHSDCARAGLHTLGTLVDHIRSLRSGGALLDPANHQTLCGRCHAVKTARVG